MLKKLTEEKLAEVLEAGISELADGGLQQTSMCAIAKRAGISVGVLYKYYENKDDFLRACIRHCTSSLDKFLGNICEQEKEPLQYIRTLICSAQDFAHQHCSYIRLYHEVTCTGNREQATLMSQEIEGISARIYLDLIKRAQANGEIRCDLEPGLLAFFFDNLLMMLHFSCCCPYYQERFKLFAGENIHENSQKVTDQLLKFLSSAFTMSSADSQQKGENLL